MNPLHLYPLELEVDHDTTSELYDQLARILAVLPDDEILELYAAGGGDPEIEPETAREALLDGLEGFDV